MEEKNAIKVNAETVATQEEVKVLPPTSEDLEAKNAALEAEKARLISDNANYKVALLKKEHKESPEDESDEDRYRRIAREELANSRIADIAREQDEIIKKALKENKELKLANLNKTTLTPPAGMGTHTEVTAVNDTLVTPEQMSAFKAKGWTDKDIERYKKNLVKYGGR